MYFAAELALAYFAIGAQTSVRAALVGTSFGLGLFAFIALGSSSWGLSVPLALTAIGIALYAVPFALWCWAGPRLLRGERLFVATIAAWSLCLEAGDALKFPLKESAQSLVVSAPLLAGGARLVGSNVLSGILLATTLAMARALFERRAMPVSVRVLGALPAFASGVGLLALLGALAQATATPSGRRVAVGVPQMATGSEYYAARLLRPEVVRRFDDEFTALLNELADTELVVTTEGFDGRFGLSLPHLRAAWQARARDRSQALALTSYTVEHGFKGNAVAGIDRTGRLVGVHRKVDLAFEGEKMLARGSGYEVFPLGRDLILGVPLCLESLLREGPFAMVKGGATLLAASTSDLSFGSNVTGFEHLATTALRAIETGRSIVWASNGGPSGVIDRWGSFEAAAPFRERRAARMLAALHFGPTPYLRLAGIVPWLSLGVLVLLVRGARFRSAVSELHGAVDREPRSPDRALLACSAALLLALALIATSPALVELSRGSPSRALEAVVETWRGSRFYVPAKGLARFRTASDTTANGAVAYFLAYYGVETNVADLPPGMPASASLEDVQTFLERQFGVATERVPIDARALPRIAAIVRERDGAFAVVTDPGGDGRPSVFVPALGAAIPADPRKLTARISPVGLVPK